MKKIILTGATGGLGKSLVDIISVHDIGELICVYRNQEKFNMLCKEYKGLHGYWISGDDDFSELFSLIKDRESNDIVLILNAFSIVPIQKIGKMSADEIRAFIYGNITRNCLLINETVNYCKTNQLGLRIINLDSGAADRPLTGWGNYCASKAFVNSFLSVVAKENPQYQIVSVDPGVMDTNMQAEIRATAKDSFDDVEIFVDYKKKGLLKNPRDIAMQIADKYLFHWTAKSLREKLE